MVNFLSNQGGFNSLVNEKSTPLRCSKGLSFLEILCPEYGNLSHVSSGQLDYKVYLYFIVESQLDYKVYLYFMVESH